MIINNNKTLTLIDRGKTITENLLYQVELIHTAANNQISQDHKNQKGQFLQFINYHCHIFFIFFGGRAGDGVAHAGASSSVQVPWHCI
jgi:hypothetical protein